jgi:hypothetical protein
MEETEETVYGGDGGNGITQRNGATETNGEDKLDWAAAPTTVIRRAHKENKILVTRRIAV